MVTRSILALAVVGALAVVSAAQGARAQVERVVLLPVGGDGDLQDVANRALAEASRVLEHDGFSVVSRERVQRLSEPHRSCRSSDCVPALLSELEATFAVAAAAWHHEGSGLLIGISVTDEAGVGFDGTAEVTDAEGADIEALARVALREARGRRTVGLGPWIELRGTPVGARVVIDGSVVGQLPLLSRATSGLHQVTVSLDGYEPVQRTVTVSADPASTEVVQVALVTTDARRDPEPALEGSSESSPVNWLVALPAIAVGTLLAGNSLYTLATDGDCLEQDPAGRCERVHFGGLSIGLLVTGAVLFGAGMTVLVLQPFGAGAGTEINVAADPQGAAVRFRVLL